MELEFQQQISKIQELSIGAKRKKINVKRETKNRKTALSIYEITIDFAGSARKWQMFFDPDHPKCYPDFIFDQDSTSFVPDMSGDQCFTDISVDSTASLQNIIINLHHQYLEHQHKNLADYPDLQNEFNSLLSERNYGKYCEIDIIKNGPGTYNDTVRFVIPMEADFSLLSPYLKKDGHEDKCCCLCLSFETPNQCQVTASLEISSDIENALGGISNLRLPECGSCELTEYVLKIEKLINSTVELVHERYQKRKSLIIQLLSTLYGSTLEYDNEFWFESAHLLSSKGFWFILYVILTEKYPEEQPMLYIQPIHPLNSKFKKKSINDYSYNPHWDDREKVAYMKSAIYENLPSMQMKSLKIS